MRRWVLGITATASLACGGLFVDATGVAQLEEALHAVSPEQSVTLLYAGAAESMVNPRCATALAAVGSFDASQRSVVLAHAMTDATMFCPKTCAADILEELAHLAPQDRMARVVEHCGEPDPFGGVLAPLRDEAAPVEYLMVRRLVEDATAVSPTFSEVVPTLAIGLALDGAPPLEPTQRLLVGGTHEVEKAPFEALATQVRACPVPALAHRMILDPEGQVVAVGGDACAAAALQAMKLPGDGKWAVVDVTWQVPAE
ncbi:MAG: hypothetical protein H6738_23200 [Alphaproteobacteria bacterium]|nr:hypothetical protein [Alphaproteobacteria bacterium]MCB9699712.1 hypothetical protein [Alphaproteobacteria bacterium]